MSKKHETTTTAIKGQTLGTSSSLKLNMTCPKAMSRKQKRVGRDFQSSTII